MELFYHMAAAYIFPHVASHCCPKTCFLGCFLCSKIANRNFSSGHESNKFQVSAPQWYDHISDGLAQSLGTPEPPHCMARRHGPCFLNPTMGLEVWCSTNDTIFWWRIVRVLKKPILIWHPSQFPSCDFLVSLHSQKARKPSMIH